MIGNIRAVSVKDVSIITNNAHQNKGINVKSKKCAVIAIKIKNGVLPKNNICYRKQKSEGFAVEISGYICLFITPFVLDSTEKLLPMLNCVSSVIRFIILFLVIYSASVYFIYKLYK